MKTNCRLPNSNCQLGLPVACAPGSDNPRRRGSALVLVMTLLGILFVLGVAFMATMNFESQMLGSQSQQHNSDRSANAMSDDMGGMMGAMMMGSPSVAFSTPSVVDSHGVYAEIPGVQNSFSSIEPRRDPGADGILGNNDDPVYLPAYVNPISVRGVVTMNPNSPLSVLATQARDFTIDTSIPPGGQLTSWTTASGTLINLRRCVGGPSDGDSDCSNCAGFPCEGLRLLDADGDGVSDSIGVDARDFGFTDTQLATLGPQLNPKSKPNGRVTVAFRIVPHGGMVDLNSSHPSLIRNVFDLPKSWPDTDPGPDYGNFKHGPSVLHRDSNANQYAYAPASEERTLRRRNMLPSLSIAPSQLLGNPFLTPSPNEVNGYKGDMAWQLLGPIPGGAVAGNYQSVKPNDPFSHRYWPYSFQVIGTGFEKEPHPSNKDYAIWDVQMEPFTAESLAGTPEPPPDYNRSHLVTTVSYDGLLQRGGRWGSSSNSSPADDLLARMAAANFTAYDRDNPQLCMFAQESTLPLKIYVLPFEYPDYPDSIVDECCVTDPSCKLNPRKGKLQLSLESLQPTCSGGPDAGKTCSVNTDCRAPGLCEGILFPPQNAAAAEKVARIQRVIYDVFVMLLNNALSTPYFADIACNPSGTNPDVDCSAGEYCDPSPPPATTGVCRDMWTNQKHSINQLTRTAASLTANLIDYADGDDIPTRIAIRDLDFGEAEMQCYKGGNPDPFKPCTTNADCAAGTTCGASGNCGAVPCKIDADCTGGATCQDRRNQLGREIDTNPGTSVELHYMYGVEKQPFITEVATISDGAVIKAWAFELFNPWSSPIKLDTFFLRQMPNPGSTQQPKDLALTGTIGPQQFIAFVEDRNGVGFSTLKGDASVGTIHLLPKDSLSFENQWTLFLIRPVTYLPSEPVTEIVEDQFTVGGNVGVAAPGGSPTGTPPGFTFSQERVVQAPTATETNRHWTATVGYTSDGKTQGKQTLGSWNDFNPGPPRVRPVELFLSNSGVMGGQLTYGGIPSVPIVPAFPTTGSMLLLMRHANRALTDYTPPSTGTPRYVKSLAFTSRLAEEPIVKIAGGGAGNPPKVPEWQQIDNGRLPIFDVGVDVPSATPGVPPTHYAMHRVLPASALVNTPGELNTLPWGQLVFDYFTALPLNNPDGPYPTDADLNSAPASQPRVDLDGLRVQGRININAAPWKVLEGLPFRPMKYFQLADRLKTALSPLVPTTGTNPDDEAGTLGESLAKSIVAYRDLRPIESPNRGGTGNYGTGTPALSGAPPTPPLFARGWSAPDPVAARRGAGFLSVGELANVRHPGSSIRTGADPTVRTFANYPYRFDAGNIDPNANSTGTDYLSAIAILVALGDWVTVRSDVFTVYGVMRGEDDLELAVDPKNLTKSDQLKMSQDANSRAIRFQETIDRLPTLLGAPKPQRIGERTISNYSDFRND